MKRGSILLELLVASAISTFVGGIVFNLFYQTNKALNSINRVATIDTSALILQSLLQRDLNGIFVPFERKEKKQTGDKKAPKGKESVASKTSSDKTNKKEEKKKEYELVPIKKGFYSVNKEGNLHILSFITRNPLPSYGQIKSRAARVIYTVKLNAQATKEFGKNSYTLFRKESTRNLYFDVVEKAGGKSIINYEVVNNIKSITAEYVFSVKEAKQEQEEKAKGEESQEQGQEKEDHTIEYKRFKDWTEVKKIKVKKRSPKDKNKLIEKEVKINKPGFFIFKVELWDNIRKTSKQYEFKMYTKA